MGDCDSYKTRVRIYCQGRFFTDLISTRGLGVRGWPSDKTEVLRSVVGRPTKGYTESLRVNGQQLSTCTRAGMESMKREQIGSILFDIQTETTTD